MRFFRVLPVLGLFFLLMAAPTPAATADCQHKGELDELYCDEDRNMIADTPLDSKQWKNPNTLVFTYTPVEKPEIYKEALADFMRYLSRATGKKVIYYTADSMSIQVEAMRSGRLHIASFATGSTCFAVNLAGYVPVAAKGDKNEIQGYRLLVLVKKDSPYKTLTDLKGKKVAHTSPSSNSGHLAPLALFPAEGIIPGKDYEIAFSGRHDQSIIGLGQGEYDAACVASEVFARMSTGERIDGGKYRIIWQSSVFPSSSIGYVYNLKPELAEKITQAILEYRFSPEMRNLFKRTDRFLPISYEKDYRAVREISKASGESYDKATLDKMERAEQLARERKGKKDRSDE